MTDTEAAIQAALNVAFAAVKIVFPPGDGPWPEVTVEYDDTAVRQAIRRAVLVGQIEALDHRHSDGCGPRVADHPRCKWCKRLAELEEQA